MKTLHVPDMKCGGCAGAVTRVVEGIVETPQLEIDLSSRQLTLDAGEALAKVRDALARAGFPTRDLDEGE